MATTAQQNSSQYVDFDEYIDFQLQKTRSNIKWTDMLTAGTGVVALVLGYLLVFVLFDHWVVDGGFGPLTRGVMLGVVIMGATGWIIWKVVLPYLKRVTTLYAARTLEVSDPKLKSSLLNFVDLAGSDREIPEHIRTAMEKQAATTLAHVDVEEAVDRKPLLKLSYLLLGIVVLGSLYTLLSPKKPWSSIQAALMPAAERSYATRTQITEVKPGDVDVLARTSVNITVYLKGEVPEEVTLLYTTEDKKFVDEPIEMRLQSEDLKEYRCPLSGENGRGLLQNLTYRIIAGDAESKSYRVTVKHPPTANVQQVSYQYPAYMELAARTAPNGQIDAWEGTTITLQATANQPVTRAMLIPLDREEFSPESQDVPLPMQIKNKTELSLTWKLEIRPDHTTPHYYAVQCFNKVGETDPSPMLYSLTIRPDKAPLLELVEPRSDIQAPANAIIPLIVKASDPDFKLSYITLKAEQAGEEMAGTPILFDSSIKQKRQNYSSTFDWKLEDYELKPGDVITFWIEARDNKLPLPNRKNSPKLQIKIVKPVSKAEAEKQLEEEKEKQQERLDQQQAEQNKENEIPEENPQEDQQQNEDEQKKEGDEKEKQDDTQQRNDKQQGDKKGMPQEGEGNPDSKQKKGEGEKQNPGDQINKQKGNQQENKEPSQKEEQDDGDVLQKIMKRQQQKNNKQKEGDKKGEQSPQDNKNPSKEQKENSNKKEDGKQNDRQMSGKMSPQKEGQKKEGGQKKDNKKTGDKNKQDDKKEGADGDKQKEPSGDKNNPDQMQGDGDSKPSDKKEGGDKEAGNNNTKEGEKKIPEGDDGKRPAGNDKKNRENAGQGEDPQQGEGTASKSDDKNKMSQQGETDGGKKSSEKEGGKKSNSAVEDGKETPAEPDKDAKKMKAKGNETGEGVPDKDPNATQAKKPDQIKPKEGTQPQKTETKGNGKPSKKESGKKQGGKESASGKKDPNKMQQKKGNPSSDKKPNGNKSSVKKEGQPQKGNPPQEGMPKKGGQRTPQDESQKSQSPSQEQGNKNNKQGEGNSSNKKKEAGMSGDKKGDQKNPQSQKESGNKKQGGDKKEGGKKEGNNQGGSKSGKKTDDQQEGKGGKGEGEASNKKGGGDSAGMSSGGKKQSAEGQGGGNGSATGTGSGGSDASAKEEAANVDHAKKATDLALKQLEDELKRGEVDKELLKELGWSEEKMKQFAKRMRKQLNKVGKADDIASKTREKQFIEMLKNLKETKGAESRKGNNDKINNINGFGNQRLPIPAEYREVYEAYTRSLSKKASRK